MNIYSLYILLHYYTILYNITMKLPFVSVLYIGINTNILPIEQRVVFLLIMNI